MDRCLTSNTSNCKNCYKCIRSCTIKSISFSNNRASIIDDDCILCGTCYNACPQELKVIRNDIDKVKQLIADGHKVYVSLAPSFIAYYSDSDFSHVKEAILELGFAGVEETAIGATIVKKAYDEMIDSGNDIVITSCCHSINMLIERYFPDCLPYLANVLSPMLAHGKDMKKRYGDDIKTIFVGPCIAKKDESDKNKEFIDYALTFKELDQWLKNENVEIKNTETKDTDEKTKARLFPTTGGIINTMECGNKDYQYISIDGVKKAIDTLHDIQKGKIHHCFIEMSSCEGSCINGPILSSKNQSIVKANIDIKQYAGINDFDCYQLEHQDIIHKYSSANISRALPSDSEIARVFEKMNKTDPKNQLNCGSCGYETCRDKAIAVIQGKAIAEMCLPFLMEKQESLSDKIVNNTPNGLIVLDENLNIQLINDSMCNILGSIKPNDVIGKQVTAILDPMNFIETLTEKNIYMRKEYLSEYNRYVENTIIHDEKFKLLICIIKDITNKELSDQKQKDIIAKTLEITDNVLNKNMIAVQEIASLLGETAAETKVALTNLKETIKND